MQKLKSCLKRTINRNKYQSKVSIERQNQYLDYLIDPSFQGVNRLFISLLENMDDRTAHTGYFLPRVEIKDHNVMIEGQKFFNQPVKNYLSTYDITRKIGIAQGDDYIPGWRTL